MPGLVPPPFPSLKVTWICSVGFSFGTWGFKGDIVMPPVLGGVGVSGAGFGNNGLRMILGSTSKVVAARAVDSVGAIYL